MLPPPAADPPASAPAPSAVSAPSSAPASAPTPTPTPAPAPTGPIPAVPVVPTMAAIPSLPSTSRVPNVSAPASSTPVPSESTTAPAAHLPPPLPLPLAPLPALPASSTAPASAQKPAPSAAAVAAAAGTASDQPQAQVQAQAQAQAAGQPRPHPQPVRKLSGRYTLSDFTIQKTLGTGSFGRVHLVRSRHNGRPYAIKVLRKEKVVRMKQVEHTNSERAVLAAVRHPFLVNLWGTMQDPTFLYMVMDFVPGGELFSLLRKSQRFPHPVAKFYAAEVALALDYLHGNGFIYRDLKPENILIAADGHLKLTDFGFAKYVPDVTWTLCGTPDYLAPEVVSSKPYTKAVDWWALGVLLYEMLAGHPPFFTDDGNPIKLYEKIVAGKVRYPPFFETGVKDLLKNLLTADRTKRYGTLARGAGDIFGHLWFAEVDWQKLARREIHAPYIPAIGVDGDGSQYERYEEVDIGEYNRPDRPDPYGYLFPEF